MKKLLLIIPLLLFGFTQCDDVDFGDTNVDDDAVVEPNTEGLMAGAMNRFFTLSGREYYARPTLYIQYQSQNVYTDEQRYNEASSTWTSYYVQTLSNLAEVYEITTASEIDDLTRTYGAPVNQAGVAELMSAKIWKRITDSFGPIPYTNALGEENLTPEYTDQQVIYEDLISRVKAARDMLDPALPGPTGDVVYGGDVEKWQKFANSFLLSLTMQLTKKYPNTGQFAATEFSAALNHSAGVIEDVEDEMWYVHQNMPGAVNPISTFRPADYNLSEPFVDALSGDAPTSGTIEYSNTTYDERLDVFADDPANPGRPYGLAEYPTATYPGPYASMSANILAPDAPLPYMTAAYTYLNRAEAAELGWTSEDVTTMFTNGVTASFESYDHYYLDDAGTLAAEGPAYAAARVVDMATAGNLQVIREEKWVALFPNGHMAWAEWRRTGVPGLTPAPDAVNDGEIPRRYIYPGDEAGVNAESYSRGLNLLSPSNDSNTSRFWWDI